MPEFLQPVVDWCQRHETALEWAGLGIILVLVAVTALVPRIVRELPADYFAHESRGGSEGAEPPPTQRRLLQLLKNVVGLVLILAGIAMLVLPGPGTVTILLGLVLMNFPGKYRLERRIVKQPAVLQSLNAIRAKAGVPPLQL